MVLKSDFSSDLFTPFLTIIGRGAQSMIGGGSSGTSRYKVTPLQVTPHVIRF